MTSLQQDTSSPAPGRYPRWERILFWCLLLGGCAVFLLMNFYTPIKEDDIFHSYIGGGTGRIGDPSGRSSERPMMTDEVFAKNLEGIKKSAGKFFSFGNGKTDAIMVNNYDWFKDITYMDFLIKYGRYF